MTTFTPEEILPLIPQTFNPRLKLPKTTYKGHSFKTNSLRLITFKTKGLSCVNCGITGNTFILEKFGNQSHHHLNLYCITNTSKTLMTKDHIIPYAKGGYSTLDNMQTMCKPCNQTKGTKI